MPTLNYRHLQYFLTVAREGSVTAAAAVLHVSQPSISAQLRKLERSLGYQLFDRSERPMALTPEGRIVLEYAEEIFRLGRELEQTTEGGLDGRGRRMAVGLASTVPNFVAYHLLAQAFSEPHQGPILVRENRTDQLLAELAVHDLDLVLADMPLPPNLSVKAYNHPLGSSAVDIFGPPLTAHRIREGFPDSLTGEPFLLPPRGFALRRSLEDWFNRTGIRPQIVAEIEDTDLINVLAEGGAGVFAAPSIIADDLRVRHAVERIGRAEAVREEYFAITTERRIRHPGVVAITERARLELAEDPFEES